MPRSLSLLLGAGLVAMSIVSVSADRGRPILAGQRLAVLHPLPSAAKGTGGPQEAEPLPPPSELLTLDRSVLLVVDTNPPPAGSGDLAIQDRLTSVGFSVTTVVPSTLVSDDA